MRRARPDPVPRGTRARPGFTLVELIVGIAVIGMLAVITVPLLRMPTVAYLEARSRTELQSQSDLLRGKMEDDLRRALPGSLRVTNVGAVWYLEFQQLRGWGRARDNNSGAVGGSCNPACGMALTRSCATENCFTTIGDLTLASASVPVNTDFLVIDPTVAGLADLYGASPNPHRSSVTSYTTVQALPPVRQLQFLQTSFAAVPVSPALLPADPKRFYIVSNAVTYVCDPAAGTLTRRSGYAIQPTQPTVFAASVASALMSNRLDPAKACKFELVNLQAGTAATTQVASGQLLLARLSLIQAVPGQPDELQPVWLQIAVKEP